MATEPFTWQLNSFDEQLIHLAFIEDLGIESLDITTQLLFSKNKKKYTAKIVNKHHEAVIFCGLKLVEGILKKEKIVDAMQGHFMDGQLIPPGATLLTLQANAVNLLKIERILLNFLQHLCGVATQTKKFVDRVKHTNTKILDTRKTMPGFRHLDKYAVFCGGGVNHRMGLYDAVLIKDNHIDFLGGIDQVLKKLPASTKEKYPVIIEIRRLNELDILLDKGLSKINRVLLDNMSTKVLTECVNLCAKKIETEASGNIQLDNVLAIAECGVNFISVGKITHSAPHVDFSMQCDF